MTNEEQLTRLELKAPYLIFLGTEPEKNMPKPALVSRIGGRISASANYACPVVVLILVCLI